MVAIQSVLTSHLILYLILHYFKNKPELQISLCYLITNQLEFHLYGHLMCYIRQVLFIKEICTSTYGHW